MPAVILDYNPSDQTAVLTAEDGCPSEAWAEVRRVCEERGQDVVNRSGKVLALPWWSILVFRRDLAYIRDKIQRQYNVQLVFTPAASIHLRHAILQEQAYNQALDTPPVPDNEVVDSLLSAGFTRTLKPYQLRNVARLASVPSGATFSVPGAGKTTEALASFVLRRQADSHLVIVAPKNAFAVWEEQLQECMPGSKLKIVRLQGGVLAIRHSLADDPDIVIISYQQLPRAIDSVATFLSTRHCFMFLDESHRMKAGPDGVSGACILSLAHLPAYKLLLSGTPMPNSVADLVPQFTFLYPEVRVVDTTVVDALRPIFVRTTKSELGLEPPRRIRHMVELAPSQQALYMALTDDAARQLQGLRANDRIRFRALARSVMHLIQAASDPSLLVDSDIAGHPLLANALAEPSRKITEVCRIARELALQGQKCVIWSYFVRTVENLASLLSDLGAEYIHGGVDTSTDETVTDSREAKLRRFHDDDSCMVLVANPAACAEGISLHKVCHHAIYVDRTYNAAQYLQSEDRIHRLGLGPEEHTTITILYAPETVDESVSRRLEAKVAAMRDVLDDRDLNIRPIDLSDESFGLDIEDIADLRRLLLGQ